MKDINSNEARKIFEELWQAGHQSEDGIQESIHSPSSKNLDIYAWSAMLQASSLDLHAVSSESLLDMLYNLRDNRKLGRGPGFACYTC